MAATEGRSGPPSMVHTVDHPQHDDAALLRAVRDGLTDAYGVLYERYMEDAYNLAKQLARCHADAEDFVSEAFVKVLDVLRAGGGPEVAFRAYLFTAMRHIAYGWTGRRRKLALIGSFDELPGMRPEEFVVPFVDTVVAELEAGLAAKAFATLPDRWQTVLRYLKLERRTPTEIAPLMGLSPNAVSVLAHRALVGLRTGYLQAHLGVALDDECRAVARHLAALLRGALRQQAKTKVETHLNECPRCRARASGLAALNLELPG